VSDHVHQGPWRIICTPDNFDQWRNDVKFQRLIMLAHVANSLRFAAEAAFHESARDGSAAARQRVGSYLYLSALLDEGLSFAQRLGEHFRDCDSHSLFRDMLRDPRVKEMRAGVLDRLRNQAVFHNDERVVSSVLPDIRLDKYEFATGATPRIMDVYYGLAAAVVLRFATGQLRDGQNFLGQLEEILTDTVDLAKRFGDAADSLIGEVLNQYGWTIEDIPPTKPKGAA
jgi:hypothetical protein